MRQAHDDVILTSLVRDVRHTAWRTGISLEDPSSPNAYASDLKCTLRHIAAGDVILDTCPGAMAPPQRKGRPPDLRAELTAELIVRLYVNVTKRQPVITHGEAGRNSVQRFVEDVCPPLRLVEPGRRILDAAIGTTRVNADGKAARRNANLRNAIIVTAHLMTARTAIVRLLMRRSQMHLDNRRLSLTEETKCLKHIQRQPCRP